MNQYQQDDLNARLRARALNLNEQHPTSNKHKGDNPENFINSHRVYRGDGKLVATTATPDDAVQLVRSLNQHTTLVEQRDLLVAALRNLIRQLPNDERLADYSLDEAEHALATVEQGGESR